MKKTGLVISIAFLVLSGVLFLGYSGNEKAIREKKVNTFKEIGFMEPYVAPYNEGNLAFEQKKYDEAVRLYQKALEYNVPKERECKVRINLALAMVTPIDEDYIAQNNVDECISTLRSAIDVLTEKGCADCDGKEGHNKDATQLKKDIEDYIKAIQNAHGGVDPDDPTDPDKPSENKPSDPIEPGKEKEIQNRLKGGVSQRNIEMQNIKGLINYNYNSGKRW